MAISFLYSTFAGEESKHDFRLVFSFFPCWNWLQWEHIVGNFRCSVIGVMVKSIGTFFTRISFRSASSRSSLNADWKGSDECFFKIFVRHNTLLIPHDQSTCQKGQIVKMKEGAILNLKFLSTISSNLFFVSSYFYSRGAVNSAGDVGAGDTFHRFLGPNFKRILFFELFFPVVWNFSVNNSFFLFRQLENKTFNQALFSPDPRQKKTFACSRGQQFEKLSKK